MASSCGCSSMVEPQSSKLATRVRFPSPAPRHSCPASLNGLTGNARPLNSCHFDLVDIARTCYGRLDEPTGRVGPVADTENREATGAHAPQVTSGTDAACADGQVRAPWGSTAARAGVVGRKGGADVTKQGNDWWWSSAACFGGEGERRPDGPDGLGTSQSRQPGRGASQRRYGHSEADGPAT
jgi:hypothetical protein